jgi:hypothetical protein
MNRHLPHPLACALLGLFALTAIPAAAAPPQIAYLEKAQTQASGTQIRSFGVPATDLDGKIKYWDVTIDLTIDTAGKPSPTATVSSIKKVNVKSNLLVAGTYADSVGGTCKIVNGTLTGGRTESAITCTKGSYRIDLSAINGAIGGHPNELELKAAGVDQLPSFGDSGWGIVGYAYGYTCMGLNHVVSARQVGTQVILTNYVNDPVVNCGLTLTPAP